MGNILEMLLNMHEQIGVVMEKENDKKQAIIKETQLLQQEILWEIRQDLFELASYHKKLNIKKREFKTSVTFDYFEDDLNDVYEGRISFEFKGVRTEIWCCGKYCRPIFDTEKPWTWDAFGLAKHEQYNINEIYKCWKDVKQEIEKQIVDTYFNEQSKNLKKLSREKESVTNVLQETLKASNKEREIGKC